MGKKIYLAAQYKQKNEIRQVAEILKREGHEIVSSWLDESYPPEVTLDQVPEEFLTDTACKDCTEILSADVFVLFTVDPAIATTRGGRHVEFGFALSYPKKSLSIYILGPRENIFHYLPSIKQCATVAELVKELKEEGKNAEI